MARTSVAAMRAQRGSISVEFAAVMPLVALVLLGVAQLGLTVAETLTLQHAAREGARTYATTADPEAARDAATAAGALDPSRAQVDASIDGAYAVIEITANAKVFPGITTTMTLRARAAMRFERAPP